MSSHHLRTSTRECAPAQVVLAADEAMDAVAARVPAAACLPCLLAYLPRQPNAEDPNPEPTQARPVLGTLSVAGQRLPCAGESKAPVAAGACRCCCVVFNAVAPKPVCHRPHPINSEDATPESAQLHFSQAWNLPLLHETRLRMMSARHLRGARTGNKQVHVGGLSSICRHTLSVQATSQSNLSGMHKP